MSTRCQVKVIAGKEKSLCFDENVTLYHHSDGYPGYMLELIGKAWTFGNRISLDHKRRFQEFSPKKPMDNPYAYQLDRPGYVGSFLCHVDPHGFMIEAGHDLHGDIEWYYVIDVGIKTHDEEWKISVYAAHSNFEDPPDLQLIMEGRISDFLNRKNNIRKEVALFIKKETEDSYIGTMVAGKRV